MGTPQQGGSGVDLAGRLIKISSIFIKAEDKIVQHLRRDSKFLQQQLGQYAPISGNFVTKFAFETLHTPIAFGNAIMVSVEPSPNVYYCHTHQLQVIPIASAIVPGAADAEPVAISANHLNIVKFLSRNDGGYQKVSEYLILMVEEAGETISARWEAEERVKKGMHI